MTAKIIATPVKVRDLKPGDLFSTMGPDYWQSVDKIGSVGERVFIRTNSPPLDDSENDETIFLITIDRRAVEVIAKVRKRDQQGEFYLRSFAVESVTDGPDAIAKAWQKQFADRWELNAIVAVNFEPTTRGAK